MVSTKEKSYQNSTKDPEAENKEESRMTGYRQTGREGKGELLRPAEDQLSLPGPGQGGVCGSPTAGESADLKGAAGAHALSLGAQSWPWPRVLGQQQLLSSKVIWRPGSPQELSIN